MSSSCRQKQGFHRPLQAAGSTQRDDLLTCPAGHSGHSSPSQNQPLKGMKPFCERASQRQEDAPNSQKWKKTSVKKKIIIKEASIEASMESRVLRSTKNQVKCTSLHSRTIENVNPAKKVSSASFSDPQEEASSSSKQPNESTCSSSIRGGLNSEGLSEVKGFDRKALAQQNIWAGGKLHETKLMKKLKSVQSWPSRDRLSVCGDVFDDVCEGLPVFGRILREIKTDYDLYVNHLMASQSPQHNMLSNDLAEDVGRSKVREKELEDAEKEVCRLEQQATRSLEENKRLRVQHELQNIPATTGPEDRNSKGTSLCEDADFKRLQVLHVAKEVQQLEEEVQEKLVSRVTAAATERHLQEQKAEIMTLIASNHRLRIINQDLENRINAVLQREKGSQATRRMLWDQIYEDLQKPHLQESLRRSLDV
ncbi:uncharacterized protein C6orf118 isoform X1 [Oryzias melastigma]|uniref:uncharacterized protein C6orf118 isoform X1 n=1 Tax=Oryzias melastigma TaxID=30732 RepID=UPI000CF81354|nr:uncharacterized protein C6orf118 isoform X1 [Oryzias melastigma]XP_024153366.1 uncharacterized protein C6orf118 isoform X1 [Oryzias melastigma]